MRETFWSVRYRTWGADAPNERWFGDKAAADKFAERDYTDKPVPHTVGAERARQIREIMEAQEEQEG